MMSGKNCPLAYSAGTLDYFRCQQGLTDACALKKNKFSKIKKKKKNLMYCANECDSNN